MIKRSPEFSDDGNGDGTVVSLGKRNAKLSTREGYVIIELAEADIWDGADLFRIREAFENLVNGGRRKIGISLRGVKYIPSGFFGLLYDLYEKGIEVCVCDPIENTRQFLWFRQFFFYQEEGDLFVLKDEPNRVADSELSTNLSEI